MNPQMLQCALNEKYTTSIKNEYKKKKSEHLRIDASELWCWRRLLKVPWTASKSVLIILWKNWCWSWNSNTLEYCEELTHWKRPWCWERLNAGGEGDDKGWDVWMASLTRWTWVWVNSGSWRWTGRPGMLQFMWSQRVGLSDWTELIDLNLPLCVPPVKSLMIVFTQFIKNCEFLMLKNMIISWKQTWGCSMIMTEVKALLPIG